jgi:hypothetical protein
VFRKVSARTDYRIDIGKLWAAMQSPEDLRARSQLMEQAVVAVRQNIDVTVGHLNAIRERLADDPRQLDWVRDGVSVQTFAKAA